MTFMLIDLPTAFIFVAILSADRWASVIPFLSWVTSAVTIARTMPTVAMTYRLTRWRAWATLLLWAASSFSILNRADHSVISAEVMRSRSSLTGMPSSRANRK